MNPRYRTAWVAGGILLVIWALVFGGFAWVRANRPTADRLARYLRENRLEGLTGEDRARALRRLAEMLNRLPADERRKARAAGVWQPWFEQMTDDERLGFIDATAPTGFRQMLESFEKLEPSRRQRAIDDALRRLREARESAGEDGTSDPGTNAPSLALSEEARARVAQSGLKAFYSQSSARSKAELAPLLEEMQQSLATGRMRFNPHRLSEPASERP